MNNLDYAYLCRTPLFQGLSEEDVKNLLPCLAFKVMTFHKNEVIFHAGDVIHSLGVVLSGCVSLENNDIWGNTNIINTVEKGQVFAETYAALPDKHILVNVIALENSIILFVNADKMLSPCSNSCVNHQTLIRNMFMISAQKNLNLSQKIFHSSPKSIRGKLLSYLSYQSITNHSYTFTIPFNRQQLADYLGVDRSAMSNELSKMQKEGILTFHKNSFQLSSGISEQ